MNSRHSTIFRQKLTLLSALLCVALMNPIVTSESAQAQARMRAIETPLEGTNIITMRVNRNGKGRIELWCHHCENNRIKLKITSESQAFINGTLVSMSGLSIRDRDFITGFYRKEDRVLTRLTVTR